MEADPQEIRVLARRIRDQGAEVHAVAHGIVARARAVGWTGLSGAAMAGQAVLQARALSQLAEDHESAARALDVHAAAVEEAFRLIAEVERHVRGAIDAARGRLRQFLGGVLDAIDPGDEVLAGFTAPPPGSPQWLEVHLPGLTLPGPRA